MAAVVYSLDDDVLRIIFCDQLEVHRLGISELPLDLHGGTDRPALAALRDDHLVDGFGRRRATQQTEATQQKEHSFFHSATAKPTTLSKKLKCCRQRLVSDSTAIQLWVLYLPGQPDFC